MYTPTTAAFQVAGLGTYQVVVNINTMQLMLKKAMPASVNLVQANGEIATLPCTNAEKGIYQGNITLTSNRFYIQEGEHRYCGAKELQPNVYRDLVPTEDEFFTLNRLGAYEVTVNLSKMRIKLYDSTYPIDYPEELYLIGNTGNWKANVAGGVLEPTTVEGVYAGRVNMTRTTFAIVKELMEDEDDWAGLRKVRLVPSKGLDAEENTELNYGVSICNANEQDDVAFRIPFSGTESNSYYVTVDLRSNKLYVLDEQHVPDGTYPKEIYLLGNDGNWLPYWPSAVLTATDDIPYIYKGKVKVETGKFILLRRLGENWGFVNEYERLCNTSQIEIGETYPLIFWDTDNLVAPGEYYFTVNLADLSIRLDDETTVNISTAIADEKDNEPQSYFDISGRNLGKDIPTPKGIYIHKNKKVVVR